MNGHSSGPSEVSMVAKLGSVIESEGFRLFHPSNRLLKLLAHSALSLGPELSKENVP